MLDQYCSMNTAKKGYIPIQLHLKNVFLKVYIYSGVQKISIMKEKLQYIDLSYVVGLHCVLLYCK